MLRSNFTSLKFYSVSSLKVALWVLSACLVIGFGSGSNAWARAQPEKPELTVGELVQVAMRKAFPLERITAISELGALRDPQEVRDQRVIESLITLTKRPTEDMFVRIAAITAIGSLQNKIFKTDNYAKNQYLDGFKSVLKDREQSTFIRVEICKIFAETLELKGLRDEQVFNLMLDLMDDKEAGRKMGQPLALRIAAADAVGALGNPRALARISSVLLKPNVDPLLKETVVRALYHLLSQVDDIKDQIRLPMINKLREMVSNKKVSIEIRAEVMKALARLFRHGVRGLGDAMAEIRRVIATEEEIVLVVAAVKALGIAGDEGALPVLKDAFSDFYQNKDPRHPKDLKVRQAIMETLGNLLAAQNERRGKPNEMAVQTMSKMLLAVIDPDEKNTEFVKGKVNEEVVNAAIFSMWYMYPKKTAFMTYHKRATDGLLNLLRLKKGAKGTPAIVGPTRTLIIKALYYITEQPYGENLERWDRWFDTKWGKMPPKKDSSN